jgi:outer membrane lipoprotein-sorting protein
VKLRKICRILLSVVTAYLLHIEQSSAAAAVADNHRGGRAASDHTNENLKISASDAHKNDPDTAAPLSASKDAALVSDADRQSRSIKSVAARFYLTLLSDKGKKITLDGTYYGKSNGDFRMKLTATFGITAVDMTCINQQVSLVLPLKRLILQGDINQALKAGISELPLLLAASNIHDLFMPMPWVTDAVERRGRREDDHLVVSVMGAPDEDAESDELLCLRRFTIIRDLRTITNQELMADNGQRFGFIQYLNHMPLQSWPENALKLGEGIDRKMEFPRAVKISHASKLSLELGLTNLSINTLFSDDSFKLKAPDNCKKRDLIQAIRSGENLLAP